MDITLNRDLAAALGGELRAASTELTRRWLDRIAARVALDPRRLFPSEEVLDRMPVLIEGIAEYLEDPADEISADVPVISKALELGELRHDQGFDAHQILKEYEILGGLLFTFLIRTVDEVPVPGTRGELLACAHRLFRALSVVQQVTTAQYMALAGDEFHEREERLRGFNRTVSHEMKNRIGAISGAAQMLEEEWVQEDPRQLRRFLAMVTANAEAMRHIVDDLLTLSRTDGDVRQQRHVLLTEAVSEVTRQLREMADAQGVELRVRPDLPEVEVNASAIELCLTNYISNAIKYSDPDAPERWVEVGAATREPDDGQRILEVWVSDNGLGVPDGERDLLFGRFFRSTTVDSKGTDGSGLGLSIVRETAEGIGGRAWAEFDGQRGSTFKIAVPLRRTTDPT